MCWRSHRAGWHDRCFLKTVLMSKSWQRGAAASAVCPSVLAVLVAILAFFYALPEAWAVPSFARKYQTSCATCHTVFPVLNSFGEAFRRDGFRFPSNQGSVDSDAVRAEMTALGQEQYEELFPQAVWPDSIPSAVPLSVVVNAETGVNLPHSDAREDAGSTFAWNDLVGEAQLFGAGAFNDTLTYFFELSVAEEGTEVEHGYLIWSDLAEPHLFNLAVGRIAPTLTSFGSHGSYLSDLLLAGSSIGPLYNANTPAGPIAMAFGHPDGVELNGVVRHRVDYSLGWVASGASQEVDVPNSQDVYAHLGAKFGGMTLDGEGPGGALVPDPMRPWEERALTLDAFGYEGLVVADNGTGIDEPATQNDRIAVLGGMARLQLESFVATFGAIVERHSSPYRGSAPPVPTPAEPASEGVADSSPALGVVQFDELAYIVYPWLVPVLRSELTRVTMDARHGGGSAHVLRLMPGVATLLRPNLKLTVSGEIDRASGAPPEATWDPTGALLSARANESEIQAERVALSLAWGF